MNQTRKNTIAIWGGGSSGIRYEALIKDAGYETIVLKRDSKKINLILMILIYQRLKQL